MTQKYFCYVDETGQDTKGDLFIVSVVVTAGERETLLNLCERIETETGKGQVKWIKANYRKRVAYMQRIIASPILHGKLNVAIHHASRDYFELTIETIAKTFKQIDDKNYKATVLIDGLPRAHELQARQQLGRLGIHAKKVRGVKKDENDALIRLADALCGFARGAIEEQPEMRELFDRAIRLGMLHLIN